MDGVRLTAAQRDLITENHPYATALAMRQIARAPNHADREEILSCAYLGLVQAVQRWPHYCKENEYDEAEGVALGFFTTYLARRINGAVLDHMRSQDWVRRSSRSLLKHHGGIDATDAEMAASSGQTLRAVREARAEIALSPVSLDVSGLGRSPATTSDGARKTNTGDHDPASAERLRDPKADVEASVELLSVLEGFANLVQSLDEIEQTVFIRRLWLQQDVAEVGRALGIRPAQVSAIYSGVCEQVSERIVEEMIILGFDKSGRIANYLASAVA